MPRGKPFPKGVSGNPKGRPKGLKDRRHALRDIIREAAPEMVAALLRKAKAGDTSAAALLLSRAVPPLRAVDEPLTEPLALPDSLADKGRAILAAVTDGRITTDQAAALLGSVAALARIVETSELEQRLRELESRLAQWENEKPSGSPR